MSAAHPRATVPTPSYRGEGPPVTSAPPSPRLRAHSRRDAEALISRGVRSRCGSTPTLRRRPITATHLRDEKPDRTAPRAANPDPE